MNKSLGLTHLPGSQLQQNSSLLSETKFDLDGCGQLSTFPILSRDTRSERHDLNVLSRNITAPQIPAQESQFIRKRSGDEAFARGSDIQASDLPNGTWKRRPTGPLEVPQRLNIWPSKTEDLSLPSSRDRSTSDQDFGDEA